jgi:DNA-binding transcriptional LysR family regulator
MWDAAVSKGLVPALAVRPVPESAYYVCTTRQRARDPQILAFTEWLFREAAARGKRVASVLA